MASCGRRWSHTAGLATPAEVQREGEQAVCTKHSMMCFPGSGSPRGEESTVRQRREEPWIDYSSETENSEQAKRATFT